MLSVSNALKIERHPLPRLDVWKRADKSVASCQRAQGHSHTATWYWKKIFRLEKTSSWKVQPRSYYTVTVVSYMAERVVAVTLTQMLEYGWSDSM